MNKYEAMAVEILEKAADTDGLAEEMELDLFEAGLLDSLSVISIIIMIEEKIGKVLVPTDFVQKDISTVREFARFLMEKDAQ